MTIEGLRLNIRKKIIKYTHNRRRKKIKTESFTIISNNCWGGMVYESFGIIKQSPTVGMFFFADEYIKFLEKFPDIINKDIQFIDPNKSKYVQFLKDNSKFGSYPIGIIDDVEICFLHFKSEEEVIAKWKRRCERINLDNLIIKMNDQNLCDEAHIKKFLALPFENKIFFTVKKPMVNNRCVIYVKKACRQDSIMASQEPIIFTKYFDIIDYINRLN